MTGNDRGHPRPKSPTTWMGQRAKQYLAYISAVRMRASGENPNLYHRLSSQQSSWYSITVHQHQKCNHFVFFLILRSFTHCSGYAPNLSPRQMHMSLTEHRLIIINRHEKPANTREPISSDTVIRSPFICSNNEQKPRINKPYPPHITQVATTKQVIIPPSHNT